MVFFSTCMFPQIWSVNLWSNALQSQCLSVVSVSALVMWSHCHLSVPKVGEKLCHVSSDWKKRRKKKEISMTREGKVAKRKNTKAKEERKELSTQTKQGKIREQMEGRGEGLTSNYQTMKENRRSEVAVSINRGEGIRGQKVRRANCETHTNTPRKPAMTRSNIWKEQTGFALCCVFHHMKPSGWATLVYECNGEEQLCDCGCNIT